MKKIILVVFMIGAIIVLWACSNKKKDETMLTIIYDANPTTGYCWSYVIENPEVIECVKDEYIQAEYKGDTKASGVGGKQKYVFKGKRAGATTITLTYKQEWDGGKFGERKKINITVDSDGYITEK